MLIVICDDDPRDRAQIGATLTAAAQKINAEVEVAAYPSGAALADAVSAGLRPALAVLDIYMEDENGIDTAHHLRALLPGLPLAFLTASLDFAVDAFELDAVHYLLKPVDEEKAEILLARFFAQTERPPRCVTLMDGQAQRSFPLDQIRYLLGADKGVEVYLPSRREWVACPIRYAAEQLAEEPDFIQISRKSVINLNFVLYFGGENCHMRGGEALPVSRRERKAVQSRYNDFLFRKMALEKEAGPR